MREVHGQTRRKPSLLTVGLVLVASAASSCTGVVGPNGGDTGTNTGALCSAAVTDPGPTFIRRLTRTEYDNVARDLLGASTAVSADFPIEEVRLGFNNNAAALSVSPALAEQYLLAAEKLATEAVAKSYAALVPCDPAATGVDACEQQFIASFALRALRRPPDADDTAVLTAAFDAGKGTDFKTGVRLAIETALQLPRFLYRVEAGAAPAPGAPTVRVTENGATATVPIVRLDDWEMASRLSFMLWRTMPDDQLLAAAEAGALSTPDAIAAQVTRMLQDPRARAMVTDFHDQWLRVGAIATVEKDHGIFPAFDASVAGLMQQETRAFIDHVVWDDDGTLATLFSAPYSYLNATLADYYGESGVSGTALVKVELDPARHAGLLTQGGLLSLLAKGNQTSPVHRGKFVREQLLCQQLPPPPPDIQIKPPDLSPTLTTRERFTQHAADSACSPCHRLMDPIGLGFENFDGAGKFRAMENGQPIDASGRVEQADAAVAGDFNGVAELGQKLAQSTDVQRCVSTQWFRYAYGRAETDADACSLAALQTRFVSSGANVRELLVALTQTDAFQYRRQPLDVGGGP